MINYTPSQRKVIELHDENILVSAAAGSGKTAVLVERIIQMISNPENPVDIDRLLIMTFTNAAASEMRERISRAIADKLVECPENVHLQRQSSLIHNAQITTIHSFCLFVLRNHFQEINLDPAFRVADEAEIKLLKRDVLDEVLESYFEEASEAFYHLVECYAPGKSEATLEDIILKLAEFADSYPWPDRWLDQHRQDYHFDDKEQLYESQHIKYLLGYVRLLLADWIADMEYVVALSNSPAGPYMYGDNFETTLEALRKVAEKETYEDLAAALLSVEESFKTLSGKKDDSVDSRMREIAKNTRNAVKESVKKLRAEYFAVPEDGLLAQCTKADQTMSMLMDVTGAFVKRFAERKAEQNMIDFGDMEHLTLKVLCNQTDDGFEPTQAALDLKSYFHEIMVDEYQDSNLVQEVIMQCISSDDQGRYNRFMVGDVKQSIYRFRMARPELFMEKYKTYSLEEGPLRRIDLAQNFRSRKEVLDTANQIFAQLMASDLGGITYDESVQLNLGASYEDLEDQANNQTELIIIDQGDKSIPKYELEAEAIAQRISQLLANTTVTDKESGAQRPVRYSDIVILIRSAAGVDTVFQQVLERHDIPCFVNSKSGYFATNEITAVIQLLRALDNPLQDIPMFGVLKSYFGGFTDEEIAEIKGADKKKLLYVGMRDAIVPDAAPDECAKHVYSETTRSKCATFKKWFDDIREKIIYMSISELLEELLYATGYTEYVSALPGGEQRKANIMMLMQRSVAFEQTSYKGLNHFIRYLDQMEKFEIDFGEAGILDENSDVVRIMTIHKSKGLEFPICFVSALGKQFNLSDTRDKVVADVDMGLGIDAIDPVKRTKEKTLFKNILTKKIRLDAQAEELRVLYVALTRPKEKLIMTGCMENPSRKIAGLSSVMHRKDAVLPYNVRSAAGSFLELLIPAVSRMEGMKAVYDACGIDYSGVNWLEGDIHCEIHTQESLQITETTKQYKTLYDGTSFKKDIITYDINSEMQDDLQKRLNFEYPYQYLSHMCAKTSVSELKHAAMQERLGKAAFVEGEDAAEMNPNYLEENALYKRPDFLDEKEEKYLPEFMREADKITGATRGSAMHRVLELLDFSIEYSEQELKVFCKNALQTGRLDPLYYEALNYDKLIHFLNSNLAGRMRKAECAGLLHKEQPFVLGIAADRLNKELPAEELVMIQGIIDVYFEEEDGIVLMDYKTDRVQSAEELIQRYSTQLDYYAEALTRILGKPVKERILYSFCLEREIPVPDSDQ